MNPTPFPQIPFTLPFISYVSGPLREILTDRSGQKVDRSPPKEI